MNIKMLIKNTGSALNRCFPKNNRKILFESNSDYCDNARALYDYLIENGYDKSYRFVWCVKDVAAFKGKNFPSTKFVSFKNPRGILPYFFHMATSKYIFYTHFVPPFMNPKVQTIVNLWHGTPLKSIKGHTHSADLFNYVLSPSNFFDEIIMDSFQADRSQLLSCGYPRNDLLFDKSNVLERLSIDRQSYQSVILWMPTFRRPADGAYQDAKLTQTGLPLIETPALLEELNQKLAQDNLFMVIKLHPGQDMSHVDLRSLSNITMLTNVALDESGVQLYHLVANADVLLTDYSSIYFDYLLLNRPIGFIIDDIAEYQQKRGFVTDMPLELMPGEKMKTTQELYRFLTNISLGQDDYNGDRVRVNDIVNRFKDNQSAKRLLASLKICK